MTTFPPDDSASQPFPAPQPRLFLSAGEWDALGDKLRDPYFQRIHENNLKALALIPDVEGEALLELPGTLEDFPSVASAGDSQPLAIGDAQPEAPAPIKHNWRAIKLRLLRSAVAWFLTHDPQFLERSRKVVDLLLNHDIWVTQYHTHGCPLYDLRKGDLTFAAVFALDVLGRFWDEGVNRQLVDVLREKALGDYLGGFHGGEWWRHADFNWGTATHGNAGLTALALEPYAPELAVTVLAHAREGLQYVIEAFPPGGGWIEGLMYQSTTLGHLTDFVAALHRVKGDDLGLPANRDFTDSFDMRFYAFGGDGHILNFSNCNERTVEYALPHACWWAARCRRPEWTWFEDRHVKPWRDAHGVFVDVEAFWLREPNAETREPELSPFRHLRGIDWAYWRGAKTWLAVRSGFNGGNHCNRDLGHFILGCQGERFLVDPGYGASDASQHNCVTLRHRDQNDGAIARIFCARHWADGCYIACDLTDCYSGVVKYYYRHFLLGDDGWLLVVDDILGVRGMRNGARFHWQLRHGVEQEEEALVSRGEQSTLRILPLTAISALQAEQWEWAGLPVTTLSWKDEYDKVHTRSATLFTFDEVDLEGEFDTDSLTVTASGREYHIDLAEGSLSAIGQLA